MNLFEVLKEVPTGPGGIVRINLVVTVSKIGNPSYRMKLLRIDRVSNDVEFKILGGRERMDSGVRNFYWNRTIVEGRGDFLKRCKVTLAGFNKRLLTSEIAISVQDPGRNYAL